MTNASTAQGREPVDTSAWMRAVEEGDAAAVKSLLDAGADVNARAEAGETALMRAAAKRRLEVVRLLLAAGADVHARSENGFTALFIAVFFGHAEVVRALLEAGSDPAAPMQLNTSPETWAKLWGDAEIAALLKGASDARAEEQGATGESTTAGEQSFLFPDEGQFRPVVPLSEISGARATEESTTPATYETGSRESEEGKGSRLALAATGDGPEDKTLVRARVKNASRPFALPPTGARRQWPAMALALVLSVTAGLLVGTYLVWPRRSAEAPPIASTADDASKAEAANQVSDSRSADAPNLPAEPEPAAASDRPAVSGDRTEAMGASRDASEAKPARTIKAHAGRGADAGESAARRVTTVVSRERPARSAEGAKEDSMPSKPTRDKAREHAARGASALSSTSVPPEHSLPISSPPPSAKSRNVIKWP